MIGRDPAASWRSRKPNQMKDREVLDKQRRASREGLQKKKKFKPSTENRPVG